MVSMKSMHKATKGRQLMWIKIHKNKLLKIIKIKTILIAFVLTCIVFTFEFFVY